MPIVTTDCRSLGILRPPVHPGGRFVSARIGGGGQDGSPQIQEMMPRLYTKVGPILGLAFGILALGFILLYRTPAAKESHDSGQR